MNQYGFITTFANLRSEEIRARIDFMIDKLNIRHFQFYDCFYTYSTPFPPGLHTFDTKVSILISTRHVVDLNIVQYYTKYIRERNCFSWLYVQSTAADEKSIIGFKPLDHQHSINGMTLFHCYEPNEQWAQRMCDIWIPYCLYMKFDGIHWDSLGYSNGKFGDGHIFTRFLTKTHQILSNYGLKQTFNFVDGFGWNSKLVWDRIIEFPYWEVWSLPTHEDYFFNEMLYLPADKKGVFVCYTYGDYALAYARKLKCLHNNCKYLMFGDGNRILYSEYFPLNVDGSCLI
jgi:hypothetical protein